MTTFTLIISPAKADFEEYQLTNIDFPVSSISVGDKIELEYDLTPDQIEKDQEAGLTRGAAQHVVQSVVHRPGKPSLLGIISPFKLKLA